jgi:hypothetical protein
VVVVESDASKPLALTIIHLNARVHEYQGSPPITSASPDDCVLGMEAKGARRMGRAVWVPRRRGSIVDAGEDSLYTGHDCSSWQASAGR